MPFYTLPLNAEQKELLNKVLRGYVPATPAENESLDRLIDSFEKWKIIRPTVADTDVPTPRERMLETCRFLLRYFGQKNFACYREFQLPNLHKSKEHYGPIRPDFLAINKAGEVVIVETKSSIADFKKDDKYLAYLDYCNRFYFASDDPETLEYIGEATKDDPNIGLLLFDRVRGGVYKKRKSQNRAKIEEDRLKVVVWQLLKSGTPFVPQMPDYINRASTFFPSQYEPLR